MVTPYLPPTMIKTTIVPIVKNKSSNLWDSSNYRPIALATIVSKMFESVPLFKCVKYLSTSDNQFGFKSPHSTNLCIYTLKDFIDYYKSRGAFVPGWLHHITNWYTVYVVLTAVFIQNCGYGGSAY